jgi:hypothetical protein
VRYHTRILGIGVAAALMLTLLLSASAGAKVLLVGTYHGVTGKYTDIQTAVNAAKPGDWILIGPGDYKTASSETPKGGKAFPAGILITKPRLFIRGMSRSKVIVDGTKPGTPVCAKTPTAQNYGPVVDGHAHGLNGIEVWKADNVWIQNLTTCNFIGGVDGGTGNEVWWNGGAGGGHIDGKGYVGSYLSATSTFFKSETTAASYGIFSSDWSGGVFDHDYASNFNDSGFYVGGCAQSCDQILENSQAEYNAIGYSGTNSGGPMLIENNKWDKNQDGFDTNPQNNSDWPSPQNGSCPAGVKPEIPGAGTCWIFYKNDVYDNNNPDVPALGSASAAPVGTGVSIEGRFDTFMDNTFSDNGAWGIVFEPYPDFETPPANAVAAGDACAGGASNYLLIGMNVKCMYDDWGNELIDNTFSHDGFYGNPSNGDTADLTLLSGNPINCYSGNTDTDGTFTSSPADIETTNSACGSVAPTADDNETFLLQAACDTEALGVQGGIPIGCSSATQYPRQTKVVMHPLPKDLATMPNPCKGVPANPWCPAHKK